MKSTNSKVTNKMFLVHLANFSIYFGEGWQLASTKDY